MCPLTLVLAAIVGASQVPVPRAVWDEWHDATPAHCVLSLDGKAVWSVTRHLREFDTKTGRFSPPESVLFSHLESGKYVYVTTSQNADKRLRTKSSDFTTNLRIIGISDGMDVLLCSTTSGKPLTGVVRWARRGPDPNSMLVLPRIRRDLPPEILNLVEFDGRSGVFWMQRTGFNKEDELSEVRFSDRGKSLTLHRRANLLRIPYLGVVGKTAVAFDPKTASIGLTNLATKSRAQLAVPQGLTNVVLRGDTVVAYAWPANDKGVWTLDTGTHRWRQVSSAPLVAVSSNGRRVAVKAADGRRIETVKTR